MSWLLFMQMCTALAVVGPARQIAANSTCVEPEHAMSDFEVSKLYSTGNGRWFEFLHEPHVSDETRCRQVIFGAPDTPAADASLKTVIFSKTCADFQEVTGTLTYSASKQGSMDYEVKLDGEGNDTDTLKFSVLATDYSRFLVARMCTANGETGTKGEKRVSLDYQLTGYTFPGECPEFILILTSSHIVDEELERHVLQVLIEVGVLGRVEESTYSGCPGHAGPGCPAVHAVEYFDIERFAGSWHDVMHTNTYCPGSCPTHVFSVASGTLAYFQKTYSFENFVFSALQGRVTMLSPGMFDIQPPNVFQSEHLWAIVDTDYESFAVVVSCIKLDYGNAIPWVRVLSRSFQLSSQVRGRVEAVLGRLGVKQDDVITAFNLGCYPDTCPPYTRAIQHFDKYRFAGNWRVVKRLDNLMQSGGRCVTVRHATTSNTSVLVQREAAPTDTAAAEGGDEEVATFEAVPVDYMSHDGLYLIPHPYGAPTSQYVILGSDYESWAAVFLCEKMSANLPVSMSAMLLSRSTDAGLLPVSDVNARLAEYDMRVEDFATSDWNQCAAPPCLTSIAVVQALNWTEFEGEWFVVKETPYGNATGFCTQHTFSRVDGQLVLNVLQYSPGSRTFDVANYALSQEDASVAKFVAHDPTGRADSFDYWILDTDYANYSVVYSCSNAAGGREKGRAWVLSRAPVLRPDSNSRVQDAIVNAYVDQTTLRDVEHLYLDCVVPTDHTPPSTASPSAAPRGPRPYAVELHAFVYVLHFLLAACQNFTRISL